MQSKKMKGNLLEEYLLDTKTLRPGSPAEENLWYKISWLEW